MIRGQRAVGLGERVYGGSTRIGPMVVVATPPNHGCRPRWQHASKQQQQQHATAATSQRPVQAGRAAPSGTSACVIAPSPRLPCIPCARPAMPLPPVPRPPSTTRTPCTTCALEMRIRCRPPSRRCCGAAPPAGPRQSRGVPGRLGRCCWRWTAATARACARWMGRPCCPWAVRT